MSVASCCSLCYCLSLSTNMVATDTGSSGGEWARWYNGVDGNNNNSNYNISTTATSTTITTATATT